MRNKKKIKIRFLSEKDVEQCLPSLKDSFNMVENVFMAHCQDKALMPAKMSLMLEKKYQGHINLMPAYLEDIETVGVKLISAYTNNKKYGLPSAMALLILYDPQTGCPFAIMEAELITALRTGVATGIVAKYLSSKNSKILGIFGAGFVSPFHIRSVAEIINLSEIKIFDIDKEAAIKLSKNLEKELNINLSVESSYEDVARNADIIVTSVRLSKPEPLVKKEWVKKGSLIITTGSMVELDYDLYKSADKLIVDNKKQMQNEIPPRAFCLLFHGDKDLNVPKILSWDDIYADIGEIILGKKKGRETDDEIILVSLLGLGTEDLIVSQYVYQKAVENNLGTELSLF